MKEKMEDTEMIQVDKKFMGSRYQADNTWNGVRTGQRLHRGRHL